MPVVRPCCIATAACTVLMVGAAAAGVQAATPMVALPPLAPVTAMDSMGPQAPTSFSLGAADSAAPHHNSVGVWSDAAGARADAAANVGDASDLALPFSKPAGLAGATHANTNTNAAPARIGSLPLPGAGSLVLLAGGLLMVAAAAARSRQR